MLPPRPSPPLRVCLRHVLAGAASLLSSALLFLSPHPFLPPLLIHPLYSCLRRATSRIRLGRPQSARLNVVVASPLLSSIELFPPLCDGIHHNPVSMAASSSVVRSALLLPTDPNGHDTRLVIRPTTLLRFVASVTTKTVARCFSISHFSVPLLLPVSRCEIRLSSPSDRNVEFSCRHCPHIKIHQCESSVCRQG